MILSKRFLRWWSEDRPLALLNVLATDGYGAESGGAYTATPFTAGGAFTTVMSASRRQAIAAAGQDGLRWAIDPGPFYTTSGATLDGHIATVRDHLLAILGDHRKVIANFHHNGYHPVLGWTRFDVPDGVGGTKWETHVDRAVKFAQMLNSTVGLEADKVAFEPFNEPPFISSASWAAMNRYQYDRIRPNLPKHTIILHGINFSSPDGVIALNPAHYGDDANVMYSFHAYTPQAVTFQGAFAPYLWISRLDFPPAPGGKSAALSAYNAAVNADGGLTSQQKLDYIAEMASSQSHTIATYFDTPQDAAWITAEYARVKNGLAVNPKQIISGELGIRGDFGGTLAATPTSRAAFMDAHRAATEANGFGACVAHEIFGDTDGYGLCGTIASFAPVTAYMDALRPA